MLTSLRFCLRIVLCLGLAAPPAFAVDVRLCTDRGAVDIALDERRAPLHTANFLRYVESGFYAGTVIHRVVPGSMVQGGSFDLALERRPAGAPVANESSNGLSNLRGTVAASRSADADSATSQFFFNLSDNVHLDAQANTPGYTVFGRVTGGLEVLDRIASLPTRSVGDLEDVPNPIVEVMSAVELDQAPVFGLTVEPDPRTLSREFETARARGDAAAILRAVEALQRSCVALSASERLAEAEAAAALGNIDRARYGLERYLATASTLDAEFTRAQTLYSDVTGTVQSRDAGELIGQCRPPVAPTVPSGRFVDQAALAAAETAVRRFRELGEIYLACIAARIDRGDLTEVELRTVTQHHNDMVVEMTAAAVRFNQAVQTFRRSRGLNP